MKILQRLNPLNNLFTRLFLWFWLVTIVMVMLAVFVARQLSASYELVPPERRTANMLEGVAVRLERIAERARPDDLTAFLSRVGHSSRLAIILVEPQSRRFVFGFPGPVRPSEDGFLQVLEQDSVFGVRTASGTFFGPVDVDVNGMAFKMFAGKPVPMGVMQRIQRRHPFLLITTALIFSGLCCAVLTWSLLKPLRQIRQATQAMSRGELSSRVGSASERWDEIGELGKDFNRMSQQLEQLISGQKRLLADISHELRSPLARLQVAIGIAQQTSSGSTDTNLEQHLARIEKEAHEIEDMIGQVLTLSRLEAMPELQRQQIHLSELITGLVDDAAYEAQAAGKKVEVNIDDHVALEADSVILASAFSNILRNAVKYAQSVVSVSVYLQQTDVIITVVDDGPGVDAQELVHIFEPFYRLSASRNRDSGGVGLGLAITQQAIKSHNGDIRAENVSPHGLRVRIALPDASRVS